ncbi:Uncharacterised protein [Mycobacteroides abscessus subsp. abscessus]|nr:Uncharacterised protein [Mycobacteroides abscessus subsp. abscessus]
MARVVGRSAGRWRAITAPISRLARKSPGTPEVNTICPTALTGSSAVLKWLNVPRAACSAMNPTSTIPVTANSVPSHHVMRLPRCGSASSQARVSP